jgi:predicted tellurium resistance membrane protein TerC
VDDAHGGVREGTTLMQAVWVIVVADVVMSLDNVLANAAAADGDIRLVVFGIALSIPIVVFLSGVLATLMNRYPWIILVAAGLLGEVAGKMMLEDHFIRNQFGHVPAAVDWIVRGGLFFAVIVIARHKNRTRAAARE